MIKKYNNILERWGLFLIGLCLSAISFNIFYAPYNIVSGGVSGLSIIYKYLFNFDESMFILVTSLIFLLVSYIFLGKEATAKSVVGSILYPIFIKGTSFLPNIIDFHNTSLLLLVIYGGALSGLSLGLMINTGFTNGGTQILFQLMNKYMKISVGSASGIVNGIIIVLGAKIFGLTNTVYAIIALLISSHIADRIILGISYKKAFYIITNKEEEIKKYVLNGAGHSYTMVDAKGGYSNKKMKMLMCVIPTREYTMLKEVILEIDKNAFFIVVDCYEASGAK